MNEGYKRNRFTFGLGTIGRDMVYTMISMYLMFYLTDVLSLSKNAIWWITGIMLAARVFDALNDPIMGVIVDNTKTKWGKFKPWILFGALMSGLFTILLFCDFGLQESGYVLLFAILYLFWGMSFTTNDISYWSMLPSLSQDQKEREKIGSIARICANVGLFFIVSCIVPITTALGDAFGSLQKGYLALSVIIVVVMWIGQTITLLGVKETDNMRSIKAEHTGLKGLVRAIFKNDQLLCTAISMSVFMIGYVTTTSFGLYFFKYVYGDEGMYSLFAIILGVSQVSALVIFPILSKKHNRKTLYTFATILVVLGYVIFFFAPTTTMIFIGIAGVLIFVGQAFIQLMMLMFLADSVEYGEWKLHKRNDSVTFSLQPFINKMGGAVASGITGAIVIISGIKDANTAADVTDEGKLILKIAMLIFPLICIVVGYIIYRKKYILDEKMYASILTDLQKRKENSANATGQE